MIRIARVLTHQGAAQRIGSGDSRQDGVAGRDVVPCRCVVLGGQFRHVQVAACDSAPGLCLSRAASATSRHHDAASRESRRCRSDARRPGTRPRRSALRRGLPGADPLESSRRSPPGCRSVAVAGPPNRRAGRPRPPPPRHHSDRVGPQEGPDRCRYLEALVYLGPEPVAKTLLRSGRSGRLTPGLARCLGDPAHLRRSTAELIRYGLVTGQPDGELLGLHRLIRECLRQGFDTETDQRGRDNARAVIIAADPGDPNDTQTWGMHALISPHVLPTKLVSLPSVEAKQLVVHQIRYLYQAGDYEGSRALGELALQEWTAGAEGEATEALDEFVVMATRHLANALRSLGDYDRSRELTSTALDRLRRSEDHGHDHPLTLEVAMSAGADLRIQGSYNEALSMEQDTLVRSERVRGENNTQALRVATNLAVSHRMLGDFQAAHEMDQRVLESRSTILGVDPTLIHLSTLNLAWDLYGLGRYTDMLSCVEEARAALDPWLLRPGHVLPLLVARSTAVALGSVNSPDALTATATSGTCATWATNMSGPSRPVSPTSTRCAGWASTVLLGAWHRSCWIATGAASAGTIPLLRPHPSCWPAPCGDWVGSVRRTISTTRPCIIWRTGWGLLTPSHSAPPTGSRLTFCVKKGADPRETWPSGHSRRPPRGWDPSTR